jgi:Phage tail sheath C-terminal domain/Phage tail sheath protein subtilisin-like domain
MPEVILPGTYIEVRAEGLISAGRVSTGNIGIVGTAAKGAVDEVQLVSSLAEAKAIFGDSDEWIDGSKSELTLIRALDLVYKNGGRSIYAVRTADKAFAKASYALKLDNTPLITLEAVTPGAWGNDIQVKVTSLTKNEAGVSTQVKVLLTYGFVQEGYEASSAAELAKQVNARSTLVKATTPSSANQDKLPEEVSDERLSKGKNGAGATTDDYATSLALLENQDVNIVVLAGQSVTPNSRKMATVLEGHLKATSEIKHERIGVIGSGFDEGNDNLDDIAAHNLNNDRLIFAAPGVLVTANGKTNRLPGGYLAAALAGLLSSLAIQASPTNKSLAIEGVSSAFNSAQLEKLTQSRVCAVEKRNGFRVVKGITTNDEAWKQITTRRIVDYAIYGVRSGCDPYIGKLNNDRVRGAMKATLDGFLTRMVESEALVSYQLEVSATRAQEVAGEAIVTMTLMPTFSIDFIKVTMYLS